MTISVNDNTSVSYIEVPLSELTAPQPLTFSSKIISINEEERARVYALVKETLEAYPYASFEFDEEAPELKIFHQEKEARALLCHLEIDKYFSLNSVSLLQNPNEMSFYRFGEGFLVTYHGFEAFKKQRNQLLKNADSFFRQRELKSIEAISSPPLKVSSLFKSFLKKYDGICVGEYSHSDTSGKALLIKNMKALYQLGIRTLFLEHIYYDSMYEHLANKKIIPEHVDLYLQELDTGHRVNSTFYTFRQLVHSALQAGIRVVPIDTSLSYAIGGHRKKGVVSSKKRCIAMNYVATRIIESEQIQKNEKYIVFMGAAHLCEYAKGIPGVSELLGVPSVLIRDSNEQSISLNSTSNMFHKPVSVYVKYNTLYNTKNVRKRRQRDFQNEESGQSKKMKTK